MPRYAITVNGGSSSIKFAVYELGSELRVFARGLIERIGLPDTRVVIEKSTGTESKTIGDLGFDQAVDYFVETLRNLSIDQEILAIGHRIVHGGERYLESTFLESSDIDYLERSISLAPNHLPAAVSLLRSLSKSLPQIRQIGCFDTGFHRTIPKLQRLLPLPKNCRDAGLKKYGFHGISYSFLSEELRKLAPEEASGKVIFAHLGNGSSLAAVRDGRSVDTTMSFTPAAGLMMGTRTGDIDPGTVLYWMRTQNLTYDQAEELLTKRSGLLGVSGRSADMRELISAYDADLNSREAVDLFCLSAAKQFGMMAISLGGVDSIVFSGGIGEHASFVRREICKRLELLGVVLDDEANTFNKSVISAHWSRVTVRVMHTDEELMIASEIVRLCK